MSSFTRILSHDDVRAVYDRIGRWQDAQAWYENPALEALIAHGDFGTARTIFEIGCGTGRLAEWLLQARCPPDAHYVGVDLSPKMVEIARSRLASFEGRAEVELSDGDFDFDVEDGSQDRVVATYVLDLLSAEDIRAFLAEAHRLLDPSGRLCLVGLTRGTSLIGRGLSSLWNAVHGIRPRWVGGCRPIRIRALLDDRLWALRHHEVVRAWGVPSEVLVASPA